MNIEQFCAEFEASGAGACRIDDVIDGWKKDDHRRVAEDYLGMEALIAVLTVDGAMGDGLLDQISPELLKAFAARRGEGLDSYDEVRTYIQEMLTRGDHSVGGVVNQIKGQLGELVFKEEAGGHAYLAHSTNQEAWDVAITHAHDPTQYVQVKIYDSADHAVKMMQDVHRKVELGDIYDGGNVVKHIDFAVNEDIFDAVRAKAALHSELNGMHVYSIPVSDNTATNVVVDGFNNVGPDELANLFGQWFGGTLTVACLHAMAQAFLVYKGAKTAAAAREAFELAIALSAPGVAAANVTALLLSKTNVMFLSGHPVIAAIAAGMIARAMAKRWYESRESMAAALEREVLHSELLVRSLSGQNNSLATS